MDKSTHKCEVVVVHPKPHPNADRLEVVEVYGYSVCVGKGGFKDGDLGVYIPPDSIVPERPAFSFVWQSRYSVEAIPGCPIDVAIPERYRRIKAKVLRGIVSEGLLMPLSDLGLHPYQGHMSWPMVKEGEDVASLLGITHYDPPESASLRGDNEVAPGKHKTRGYPKTAKGWFRYLMAKVLRLFGMRPTQTDQREDIAFKIPDFDVDSWQRYKHLLIPGEEIWITEKIHGANARYMWAENTLEPGFNRLYVGSHHQWKKQGSGNSYWECVRQNPWILDFCKKFPNHVLYGELVPTQKMKYGQAPGKYRLFGFDVYTPDGRWLSRKELEQLDFNVTYEEEEGRFVERHLLDEVHWVPEVARLAYAEESIRQFSLGKSLVPHANNIREGIVIRPSNERTDPRFGRVILKIVSTEYLASKQSDEQESSAAG